jgi:hypothetical protein
MALTTEVFNFDEFKSGRLYEKRVVATRSLGIYRKLIMISFGLKEENLSGGSRLTETLQLQ